MHWRAPQKESPSPGRANGPIVARESCPAAANWGGEGWGLATLTTHHNVGSPLWFPGGHHVTVTCTGGRLSETAGRGRSRPPGGRSKPRFLSEIAQHGACLAQPLFGDPDLGVESLCILAGIAVVRRLPFLEVEPGEAYLILCNGERRGLGYWFAHRQHQSTERRSDRPHSEARASRKAPERQPPP